MTWQCFVEIVQVITQIATAMIAGIGLRFAYKAFIRESVQEPEHDEVKVTEAEAAVPSKVKVFETSQQTTTLEVTVKGLECWLDDRRPGKSGGHQWTITKNQAKEILAAHRYRVHPGYKLHSGLFSIGPSVLSC